MKYLEIDEIMTGFAQFETALIDFLTFYLIIFYLFLLSNTEN